jgi:3-oxoacyl-[acyl-carrier protein] reductase
VQHWAAKISTVGGAAEAARVDALDEQAVEQHAAAAVTTAGGIDISFNAISLGDVQGTPLLEMPLADFSRPITTGATTHFLTARASARHMVEQGSGVILTLTASAVRLPDPVMGPPHGRFRGRLCSDPGPHSQPGRGARATGNPRGLPAERGIPETWRSPEEAKQFADLQEFHDLLEGRTLLRRLPTLDEVANVAAFVASDRASAMTATVANVTCGSVVDYWPRRATKARSPR